MIRQVSLQKNDSRWKIHKTLVSVTGYSAAAVGAACAVTGMKSVKFANKMKVHKYSGWFAGFSTIMHIAVIKGIDKFLYKNIN